MPTQPVPLRPCPPPAKAHHPVLTKAHARRLRDVWRSSGWPSKDPLELDLLAAGLIEVKLSANGHETLRLTREGLQWLMSARQHARAQLGPHERVVAWVAANMARAGRLSWQGLSLRTWVAEQGGSDETGHAGRWVVAMPDVFSIRNTTLEEHVEPVVHEIKVRRADLLADLRNHAKRAAYLSLASQVWYVLAPDVGRAEEVPTECGVMRWEPPQAQGLGSLEVLRPAPARPMRLSFAVWMALAKACPMRGAADDEPPQAML